MARRASFEETIWDWWSRARFQRDDLPWRNRQDPWEVLVAEVMLTQTQASRVAAPYVRFIGAYPKPEVCADASQGDVLRLWNGLGYNKRALQLHRCAQSIVARHGGRVPSVLADLLALPGVGPYVARAVGSFAFALPVGVIDTNIGRVLSRAVAGQPLGRAAAHLADSLVPSGYSREWNLALMDLGNLVCRARSPVCEVCPVGQSGMCAWRAAGGGDDPASGSASAPRRQAPFAGSDRQARGRLIAAACRGEIKRSELAAVIGLEESPERAQQIARQLLDEGLLVELGEDVLALP